VNLIEIEDNPNLNNLNFTGLRGADAITIARNGPAAVLLLPNIEGSSNISVSNVLSIDISSLQSMDYDGGKFFNNTFSTLSMPKMFSISGSLYIVDNPFLDSLDISSLTQVATYDVLEDSGNIVVMNNPLLQSLVLPKVWWVTGTMNLTGNFST
jgi:hypothetical protein